MLATLCILTATITGSTPDARGVPSAGAAILDGASAIRATRSLLAQAGDEGDEDEWEEMKALEDDMDRARRHIDSEVESESEAQPRARRRRRVRDADLDYRGTGRSSRPRRGRELLVDGHGKAYYLTWGIVDWAIAGQLWVGSAGLGIGALVLGFNADEIAGDGDFRFNNDTSEADALRTLAIVYGVLAVAAAAVGVVMAFKAQHNLTVYRGLRDRGRLLRHGRRELDLPDPHRHEEDVD